MVSNKNERMNRARNLLHTLVGSKRTEITYGGRKRPHTLPAGVNYSAKEWTFIREASDAYKLGRDVSIQLLFELDEIAEKYKDHLFLAKLHI
jgi:hypothetical protein